MTCNISSPQQLAEAEKELQGIHQTITMLLSHAERITAAISIHKLCNMYNLKREIEILTEENKLLKCLNTDNYEKKN